jgi:hypothetical protein
MLAIIVVLVIWLVISFPFACVVGLWIRQNARRLR